MSRPEWILDSSSFTSTSALVREMVAWLEFTDCKLIVRVKPEQLEQLASEFENYRPFGRVKVIAL